MLGGYTFLIHMAMAVQMLTGKVTSLSKEKGFGFIQPATGGPDVFFHITTLAGDFGAIQIGETVHYEADLAAQKPRAQKVERADAPGASSTADARAGSRTSRHKHTVPRQPSELGFITKLRKREKLGFISADAGGPEILFGVENVTGERKFAQLAIGDSVRFVRSADTDEVGPPLASSVQYAERSEKKSGLDLPPNLQARRRKPTWRR